MVTSCVLQLGDYDTTPQGVSEQESHKLSASGWRQRSLLSGRKHSSHPASVNNNHAAEATDVSTAAGPLRLKIQDKIPCCSTTARRMPAA